MNKYKKVPYRRKRQGKTDYKKRLKLLKSRKLRVVIRKTNRFMIVQLVQYAPDGDKVLLGVSSRSLKKIGWKLSCHSIPSAYLAGFLFGKKAAKIEHKEAILDIGLLTPIKGSRIFAVVKGMQDAGFSINAGESVSPTKERLAGNHIKDYYSSSPDRFSIYNAAKLKAEDVPTHVAEIKAKITKG